MKGIPALRNDQVDRERSNWTTFLRIEVVILLACVYQAKDASTLSTQNFVRSSENRKGITPGIGIPNNAAEGTSTASHATCCSWGSRVTFQSMLLLQTARDGNQGFKNPSAERLIDTTEPAFWCDDRIPQQNFFVYSFLDQHLER